MRLYGILFAVMALLSGNHSNAYAQQLPPGMTMHRIQAGEPDTSGWALANSTEGSYSVQLPCKFNDYKVAPEEKSPTNSIMHMVGCQISNGLRYSANRADFFGGDEVAQKMYADFSFSSKDGEKTVLTEGVVKGNAYKQFSISTAPQCAEARIVKVNNGIVMLVVEAIGVACFDFKLNANKFFASLEIVK